MISTVFVVKILDYFNDLECLRNVTLLDPVVTQRQEALPTLAKTRISHKIEEESKIKGF